jgi:hypothetical protein
MSRKAINYELTDAEKEIVLKEFETTKDLMQLTKKVFNDETLDGRSAQGRAVRQFLAQCQKNYETSLRTNLDEIELTKEQKEFLMGHGIEAGMTALEIAKIVFQDAEIVSLSLKHRTVNQFLRKYRPEIIDDDIVAGEKWMPPKALSRAIKKVNDWTGSNYEEVTMPTKQKRCCEKLLIYLQSFRFGLTINEFSTASDRNLFESEFVRVTWDKPDLTIDELNLYITMCSNYVRQRHIQSRMDKLNTFLAETENDRDVTMRLTEIIKATSEELNQCEKRIESLAKDLNGGRKERLLKQGEQNGNIFALVEAFRDKEERDRMILMAELQNKAVEDEADRLESMDEFKARILGISKRELL